MGAGLLIVGFLLTAFALNAQAQSSSAGYRMDYGRVVSDAGQKTSSGYKLLGALSDIESDGASSGYHLRNIYAGLATSGPVCGNAVIETGEACEGNDFNGVTCADFGYNSGTLLCSSCQIDSSSCYNTGGGGGVVCGNGVREGGEQCDDGNILNGDGCSSACRTEYAACGNGVQELGEACDDGNIYFGDGCTPACQLEAPIACAAPPCGPSGALCGNGIQEIGEECDGELYCSDDCKWVPQTPVSSAECGNNLVEIGEECDGQEDCSAQCTWIAEVPEKPVAFVFPPLKPAAPPEPGVGEAPGKPLPPAERQRFHFEQYREDEEVTIIDETPFLVVQEEADQFYELAAYSPTGDFLGRQGVQADPNGIVMVEMMPYLEYKAYRLELLNDQQQVVRSFKVKIDDRPYREHELIGDSDGSLREWIRLGPVRTAFQPGGEMLKRDKTFFSGYSKPNNVIYTYFQSGKTPPRGQTNPITLVRTQADGDGFFEVEIPASFEPGPYLAYMVQVYQDRKVSRNKRYTFELTTGHPGGRDMTPWVLIAIALAAILGLRIRNSSSRSGPSAKRALSEAGPQRRRSGFRVSSLIVAISLILSMATWVYAATTTPAPFIYEGKLLDTSDDPVTTAQTFRFSFWTSKDKVAGDITGAGAINILAPAYGGWNEVQTVTPNADGTFSFELGSVTPLPDMDSSTHKYLQVEIKASGDPDTSYQLMDPTGDDGADADDRQTIGSTPFTNNADFIDNAEVGTGAGDLAVLGAGDVWDISFIPGGTNADVFTLDNDDTIGAGGTINLQFGATLAETLQFDIDNDWFNFTNDLNVGGNITQEGNSFTLDSDNAGAGVDVDIVANQGSDSDGTLRYNATTNQWELSNDGGAFAKLLSSPAGWTDIATRVKEMVFSPEFSDATVEPDGTNNKGTLTSEFVDGGGTAKHNYYEFTTNSGALQDVDVVITFTLPLDFASFTASPLSVLYQTADGVAGNNKIDLALYDTTGTAVALTGGTGLVNAAWTTAAVTFGGVPAFTAGDTITLRIKLSALTGKYARVSDVIFEYNGR